MNSNWILKINILTINITFQGLLVKFKSVNINSYVFHASPGHEIIVIKEERLLKGYVKIRFVVGT